MKQEALTILRLLVVVLVAFLAAGPAPVRAQSADRVPVGQACLSAGLKGMSRSLRDSGQTGLGFRLPFGYRYNELVVTQWDEAFRQAGTALGRADSEDYTSAEKDEISRQFAWLQDRRNRDRLSREVPAFWRLHTNSGEIILTPPVVGAAAAERCEGARLKLIVPDEHMLFVNHSSPRIVGDLCAEEPEIVIEPKAYANLRMTDYYGSRIASAAGLPLAQLAPAGKFDDTIRKIAALREAQCGLAVQELHLSFQQQIRPVVYAERRPTLTDHDRSVFDTQLELVVWLDDGTLRADEVKAGTAALAAERSIQRQQAMQDRRQAQSQKVQEHAAIGALLVLGGLAFAGAVRGMECAGAEPETRPLSCPE